nr:1566_t:CDS:2 [Entrophospora candida]
MDLDFILNVISDGPTKSYAYRRLQYLERRYSAELTKVIANLKSSKYQMAEYRIKIGMEQTCKMVVNNEIFSPNVRWLIQMPRLYSVYKNTNTVESFEDLQEKSRATHILQRAIGFISVDDESKAEKLIHKKYPAPE